VLLPLAVEASDTLNNHVVRLCRTRGKDHVLGVGADEVRDVL
jgi:hypothetical protein